MAWRARSHFLTRNPAFLLKTSLIILAIGLGLALLIVAALPKPTETTTGDLIERLIHPGREHLRDGLQELQNSPTPEPRKLARWLRRACILESTSPSKTESAPPTELTLSSHPIAPLLDRHAPDPTTRSLFEDYLTSSLHSDPETATQAQARLQSAADQPAPTALANQLLAQLLVNDERPDLALSAFIIEGLRFPDAAPARSEALHWAVHLKDIPRLKEMLAAPGWINDSDPSLVYHAAGLTGNVWLQWRMLVQLRLKDLPIAKLSLALFSTALWYTILVQLSGSTGRWRWSLPLLPLIAGVASVWPTLSLVTFQDDHLGLSENAPFPHNLWYFFGGIGLREELCKLLLFVPFLPWLLKKRNSGYALLTGAFVGLGFALEENLNYYDESGGSVVIGRFITANFMHVALTGIAAHGLYITVRSGFTRVADFAGSFVGVVAAHGLYDLVIILDRSEQLGIGFLSIVVLFFIARHFFTQVELETPTTRAAISPLAVFFIGSATLVAALFIVAACVTGTTAAIAEVGQGSLGVLPVGFMFWKHLH
jgi:RsiW-degrading membrane proteinase PrsW (M82 family)